MIERPCGVTRAIAEFVVRADLNSVSLSVQVVSRLVMISHPSEPSRQSATGCAEVPIICGSHHAIGRP